MFKLKKFAALASLVSLVPLVVSQAQEWGQCGGIGWTGPTTCASGTSCVEQNEYYSQCLPGAQVPTTTAGPTTSQVPTSTAQTSAAPTSTSGPIAGNPFEGCDWYISPYYADEIEAATAQITDATIKAKAASVANVPTFVWLDSVSKIPSLDTYLADAATKSGCTLVPIVVYDLPNRDCHAKASNGEFFVNQNGVENYQTLYIDKIVEIIKKYPGVNIVAVIEPDSLANLVTNLSDPNCQAAQQAYLTCTNYAIKELAAVGVTMYLDAGHAGWLGWPANLTPAAQLFAQIYSDAGAPAQLRGLATNVANYNALRAASPDPITQGNPNYDEIHYIEALGPALEQEGFPAHFIVDQGRSGQQNLRQQWGDWCNIKGAGFGTRPTTNTGSPLIDSVVWVKPGGESDGTSNSSSPRYDSTCSLSDAHQPAPEAGTWFQAYFENLVSAANPSL